MEPSKINIHQLTKDHLSGFIDLCTQYFSNELKIFLPTDVIKERIIQDNIIKQFNQQILFIDIAILKNKTVAGFIIYQIDNDKSDWNERTGHGFIREFYVDKQYQKQGIGTLLIKSAEYNLKKLGTKNIYLTSSSEYYVEDFYSHNGYSREYKASPKNHNEYFSKEL